MLSEMQNDASYSFPRLRSVWGTSVIVKCMETEPRYNEPSLSCSEQNFASPFDLRYIHVPLCFESPNYDVRPSC